MQKICFATNNKNKLKEISAQLKHKFEILSLNDIECDDELPETGNTIEANSLQKAQYIFDKFGIACFADDTGLEVESLNGAPGVYSARYAGEDNNAENNMNLLLKNMASHQNRKARFKTVITYIDATGAKHTFEGICEGSIRTERSGEEGFGYDPTFEPSGYNITFAEMDLAEKNQISHRGKAVAQLMEFLKGV